MTGIITKIDPEKKNSWGNDVFIRIYFKIDDGTWAQTDVVPSFRNFQWWEPIIKSGLDTKVGNLAYKSDSKKGKIDADCQPYIIGEANKQDPLRSRNYSSFLSGVFL